MTAESDVNALAAQVTALKNEITNSKTALDHYKDLATERDATATTLNTAISGVRNEAEDIKDATNTAYQLSTTAAPVDNLAGWSATPIHNAVVAAFVYDTTKDSDGGAWRKRTQKTSWYNESGAATGKWLGVHASEADARNAYPNLGSELVTNGTFNTDLTGWTASGSGTASYYYGSAQFQDSVVLTQSSITTGAKTLKLSWDQTIVAGTRTRVRLRNAGGNADVGPFNYYNGSGSFEIVFSTSDGLSLQFITEANHNVFIDNISVKEITSQTTQTGDYFQLSTNGYFYKLNPSSGTTQVYRGSRNEFPAVAVIVALQRDLIIYDGDDPTLPMWMVFDMGSGSTSAWYDNHMMLGTNAYDITGITAGQGNLLLGTARTTGDNSSYYYGLTIINFLSDDSHAHGTTVSTYLGGYQKWNGNISQRNTQLAHTKISNNGLVDGRVKDVAMTVLPAAPIDPATGLPIPTIAVATDGGVSIIKDDGTVVDIRNGDNTNHALAVAFTNDNRIACQLYDDNRGFRLFDIPDADISQPNHYSQGYADEWYSDTAYSEGNVVRLLGEASGGLTQQLKLATYQQNLYSGHLIGVSTVARNPSDQNKSMVNYTLPDYISGWMLGDIKLATLADTDSTSLVDIELIENGAFGSDISGWSAANYGNPTVSYDSGRLKVVGDGVSTWQGAYTTFSTKVGKKYKVTADIENPAENATAIYLRASASSAPNIHDTSFFNISVSVGQSVVQATRTFTATSTTMHVHLMINGGGTGFLDNVSIKEVVADRSYRNLSNLAVNGTITREPVAPGAELVGYSGFNATGVASTSKYLSTPYSSSLDLGSGEFCIMWWSKKTVTATRYPFDRKNPTDTSGKYTAYEDSNGNLNFLAYASSGSLISGAKTATAKNVVNAWNFNCVVRDSSDNLRLYVNGISAGVFSGFTGDITDSTASAPLVIGNRYDHGNNWTGYLALLRISGTAPTAEQIEYIYASERVLFNDNAKCTIYGTSDNIKALAHDEDTGLLHVGTSAGRSVFKGLRRVEATTAAVGSTISAVNGVVVED